TKKGDATCLLFCHRAMRLRRRQSVPSALLTLAACPSAEKPAGLGLCSISKVPRVPRFSHEMSAPARTSVVVLLIIQLFGKLRVASLRRCLCFRCVKLLFGDFVQSIGHRAHEF